MITVNVNDKENYNCPTKWADLTAQQLKAIAPVLLQKDITIEERTSIAFYLCGFGNRYFTVKEQRKKLSYQYFANEIYDKVLPEISFLFTENELTEQLLPSIQVGKRFQFFGTTKLHGPSSNFENLTLAEFSNAETCISNWEQTKNDLWLNRFIAVMYRPAKMFGTRQPFNFHANDLIAAMLTGLDIHTKSAIVLWYYGCRKRLVGDFSSLFSKKSESGAPMKWTDMIHEMAGTKFGTIDETGQQPVRVIFYELQLLKSKAA